MKTMVTHACFSIYLWALTLVFFAGWGFGLFRALAERPSSLMLIKKLSSESGVKGELGYGHNDCWPINKSINNKYFFIMLQYCWKDFKQKENPKKWRVKILNRRKTPKSGEYLKSAKMYPWTEILPAEF